MTDIDTWEWFSNRTFHHSQFEPPAKLRAAKERRGLSVSVCLPVPLKPCFRAGAGLVGIVSQAMSPRSGRCGPSGGHWRVAVCPPRLAVLAWLLLPLSEGEQEHAWDAP
jgi:hypothetical protein